MGIAAYPPSTTTFDIVAHVLGRLAIVCVAFLSPHGPALRALRATTGCFNVNFEL